MISSKSMNGRISGTRSPVKLARSITCKHPHHVPRPWTPPQEPDLAALLLRSGASRLLPACGGAHACRGIRHQPAGEESRRGDRRNAFRARPRARRAEAHLRGRGLHPSRQACNGRDRDGPHRGRCAARPAARHDQLRRQRRLFARTAAADAGRFSQEVPGRELRSHGRQLAPAGGAGARRRDRFRARLQHARACGPDHPGQARRGLLCDGAAQAPWPSAAGCG